MKAKATFPPHVSVKTHLLKPTHGINLQMYGIFDVTHVDDVI